MKQSTNHQPVDTAIGDYRTANSAITPWIRSADLKDVFQSSDLAFRCIRGGWLNPVIKGNRRAIYKFSDVLSCLHRIENGEMPPPRPRTSAK
jgi:hypothetical protein